jgi:hypothetical protein
MAAHSFDEEQSNQLSHNDAQHQDLNPTYAQVFHPVMR